MPGAENIQWIIWGAIMAGLALQLIGTMMGPAPTSAGPLWLLVVGAGLMFVSASAGVVISLIAGERGAVARYASAAALVLGLLLVMRRRHARDNQQAVSGEPGHDG